MKYLTASLIAAAVLLVVVLSSIYIVDTRQKAIVLQFGGQIVQVRTEPGLYFKVPFIQNVVSYDARILSLDTQPIEVTLADNRRLVVDAFTRYRIADVVTFQKAVGGGGMAQAERTLNGILLDQIRAVLGAKGVTSSTLLSAERTALMNQIRDNADVDAAKLGVKVVDVRLKQTNLPQKNLAATFDRMRAEREREATDERARGAEAAQRIRAQADRTVTELVSDAKKNAEIVRGEADARRTAIFANAYGADPDFFRFYRSLTAYQNALKGSNSTMVISPDSEFFDFLNADGLTKTVPGAAAPALGAPAQ